jgi:ribosomal protein L35
MTCHHCDMLQLEYDALMERFQITESGRFKAEKEAKRLHTELHGSTSKESRQVREICAYHNENWMRVYPKARGLKYPMTGANAAGVRKQLRAGYTINELKRALDGAFISEWHLKTPRYLYLKSLFDDENKVLEHIKRAEAAHVLWPPIERVLLALQHRKLKWDGVFHGEQTPERTWKNVGECPLCHGRLLVGVRREVNWATIKCLKDCDFFKVLDALGMDGTDLAHDFDPDEVEKPERASQANQTLEPVRGPGSGDSAVPVPVRAPALGATELFERDAA